MILQHDNARPHVAKSVKTYLVTVKWEVLPYTENELGSLLARDSGVTLPQSVRASNCHILAITRRIPAASYGRVIAKMWQLDARTVWECDATVTSEQTAEFVFHVPAVFPAIAPSGYYLLRSMAYDLTDEQFRSYEDIENGIRALPERWAEVVANDRQ